MLSSVQVDVNPVPKPAWDVFAHPYKVAEARVVMASKPAELLATRGDFGETALHWAAMSDGALAVDLVMGGFDANARDASGRTPLDWLHDRVRMVSDAAPGALRPQEEALTEAEFRQNILNKSSVLVQLLMGAGFRASDPTSMIRSWLENGWYRFVTIAREMDDAGAITLSSLGEDGAGALHVMAGGTSWNGRREAMGRLTLGEFRTPEVSSGDPDLPYRALSVDEPDAHGKTPLRWALDAWRNESLQLDDRAQFDLIVWLLKAGADPCARDDAGMAPANLLQDGFNAGFSDDRLEKARSAFDSAGVSWLPCPPPPVKIEEEPSPAFSGFKARTWHFARQATSKMRLRLREWKRNSTRRS